MFETTKGFIETYIDTIEQMDWRALFDFFYSDHLANRYCEEIVLTLKNAFPEQTEAIKAAQEHVFNEYFDSCLTATDYYTALRDILSRLPNFCGFQIRKIKKIIEDNGHTLDKRDGIWYLVN